MDLDKHDDDVCDGSSPEGTETHAANHVEKRVKYEQTQQQIEEHGLWEIETQRKKGVGVIISQQYNPSLQATPHIFHVTQHYQTPNWSCVHVCVCVCILPYYRLQWEGCALQVKQADSDSYVAAKPAAYSLDQNK